jgi:hypothetical protein
MTYANYQSNCEHPKTRGANEAMQEAADFRRICKTCLKRLPECYKGKEDK